MASNIILDGCLGKKGREGSIYKCKYSSGRNMKREIVAKVFRKNKNEEDLCNEYNFLKKASKLGISPRTYGYGSLDGKKYILMDRMCETLYEIIKKNSGELCPKYQRRIIEIFCILDKNNIYHEDTGPLNFMTDKDGELFIIDFGVCRKIDKYCLEKYGDNPNMNNGLLYFILKSRLVFPKFMPKLLVKRSLKR